MNLKPLAHQALASVGLSVRREVRGTVDGFRHQTVRPVATYSPWLTDVDFMNTYQAVVKNTLVDIYRCWELWQLVEQLADLDGNIIEVGVWRGGTGCLMAKRAQLLGLDLQVYLCDTFAGVVKATDHDASYNGGEHSDTSVDIVRNLVVGLGLDNVVLAQGIYPDETQHIVGDAPIRLLHIDVDVYKSAHDIVKVTWPRLVQTGVVVFDDYGFKGTTGITRYVNETMHGPDRRMIHNLNGHAVVIKTS